VSTYFIWELPVGPDQRWANSGWISHVVGGWRLGGIGMFASGRPLVLGGVTASNGVSTGLGAHANLTGDPKVPAAEQTLDRWFNSGAFAQPTCSHSARERAHIRTCVDRRSGEWICS